MSLYLVPYTVGTAPSRNAMYLKLLKQTDIGLGEEAQCIRLSIFEVSFAFLIFCPPEMARGPREPVTPAFLIELFLWTLALRAV